MNEETNNEKSLFEKVRESIKKSVTLKLVGIGIIILLMQIPLGMIDSLLYERRMYLNNVQQEIQQSWGNDQVINGLELTIPYSIVTTSTNSKTKEVTEYRDKRYAHFLPSELNIDGDINTHQVHRGIYDVTVYDSDIAVKGTFSPPNFDQWKEDNWEIHWDQAFVSLGIKNVASIKELIKVDWSGNHYTLQPGSENSGIIRSGMSTPVKLNKNESVNFNFDLALKGSQSLQFVPLGKVTNVHLKSPWSAPKFSGNFSPITDEDKKIINDDGFDVQWKVLYLNRSFPQQYLSDPGGIQASVFGVDIFEPVDEYTKTTRSAKYALLFIALTFITFFFIQIINKVNIHFFQFIIVGLALSLFYILLISLSEHVGFNNAYFIAASGIILEISLYVKAIFKSYKLGFVMLGLLIVLYTFIFIIIQLESYSLLAGSIGLFIVLGLLMYLSRNIDWKNIGAKPAIA